MTAPILQATDIRKSFGQHQVLRSVSLTVQPGEVVVLAGRSGAGKSTLLRCLNALELIDSGTIVACGQSIGVGSNGRRLRIGERELARQRRLFGMVFQSFNLFPHLTALENITVGPMRVLRRPAAEAVDEASELLRRVHLPEKAGSYPSQLSGGQQQRVAIARALAMNPRIMLFDEPTSALDPEMIGEVLDVMRDLSGAGMTMVVVTHEMSFARAVADRLVLMNNGQIVEDAPPRTFFAQPASQEGRLFLARVGKGSNG